MIERIDALFIPLIFDQGLSPGEGSHTNRLTVARDGLDRLVLRGTSIAGVLRHAEEHVVGADVAKIWFGQASDEADETQNYGSLIKVDDATLSEPGGSTFESTHHLRNRHTGVVTKHGLYSIEACPPGTKTWIALWVQVLPGLGLEAKEFTQRMCRLFHQGLVFGGRSARGIGEARVDGAIQGVSYSLVEQEGMRQYLVDHRLWRAERKIPNSAVSVSPLPADPNGSVLDASLTLNLRLEIPAGQDLLISASDEARPERVFAASSPAEAQLSWLLPGSSVRGAFRDWMTRLAVLDGYAVQDSAKIFGSLTRREERKLYPLTMDHVQNACPINQLFGTVENRSRIRFTHGLAPCQGPGAEQYRAHVAIDPISGGAMQGRLFANHVLTLDEANRSPQFEVKIHIDHAQEHEATWLAKTIVSLHHGVLRLGSSKASGRVRCQNIFVTGRHSRVVAEVVKNHAPDVNCLSEKD